MKKLLSCREVGCYECDFIVTGETEEEIMSNAVVHGIKEHSRTHKDMVEYERETQRICSYAD